MAQMRIAFRVDASIDIGTGHVMRCLTLADALREQGAISTFICRPHEGHLMALIAERGFTVCALPTLGKDDVQAADESVSHAAWLGTHWRVDAQDTGQALLGQSVDWLIIDHYALDQRWEQMVRPLCHQIMVIDDLADRGHDCDLLLDQNLGRRASDYENLVAPEVTKLIGPRYAMLRAEFSACRPESLARRVQPKLQHLLITMGGVDKDNATGRILHALAACALPQDFRVSVVLGPRAPWVHQVTEQARHMPCATEVQVGVNHMARLMTDCDLAISAAGGTVWELCCLGVPSLIWVMAENQKSGAAALQASGAVVVIHDASDVQALMQTQLQKDQTTWLGTISAQAASITDGAGAQQLVEWLQRKYV